MIRCYLLCLKCTNLTDSYSSFTLILLQLAQRHWGLDVKHQVKAQPGVTAKACIQRLGEGGVEGVKVDQTVTGDSVEGHNAGRIVYIHCYSLRERRWGWGWGREVHLFALVVVADSVAVKKAAQTPRLIISSKPASRAVAFSFDSSVTHTYIH